MSGRSVSAVMKGHRSEQAINLGGDEWVRQGRLRVAELVGTSGRVDKGGKDPEAIPGLAAAEDSVVTVGRDDSTASVEGGKTSAEKSPIDASSDNSTELLYSLREKWPTTLPRELPSGMAVELPDQLRKDGDISGAQDVYTHAIEYDHGNSSQRSVALTIGVICDGDWRTSWAPGPTSRTRWTRGAMSMRLRLRLRSCLG